MKRGISLQLDSNSVEQQRTKNKQHSRLFVDNHSATTKTISGFAITAVTRLDASSLSMELKQRSPVRSLGSSFKITRNWGTQRNASADFFMRTLNSI